MGDVSGWELGATYVTRSSPRTQDTVVGAQCNVEWSDRWGRYMPSDWMSEHITVLRRELDHDCDCGNPACTDQEVTHCTPYDERDYARVEPGAATPWARVCTVVADEAPAVATAAAAQRQWVRELVQQARHLGVVSDLTVPGDGAR